ncbi:MAG: M1 family aminopeptidase [Candidatus Hodarchaeota archaeon]
MNTQYLIQAFANEELFQILNYDLLYEIDLENTLFKSEQKIIVKNNSQKSIEEIEAILHGYLVIDSIIIKDFTTDKTLNFKYVTTQFEDQFIRWEGFEGIQYQFIKINLEKSIKPNQELLICLNVQMPAGKIKKSKPEYMWSFVVNQLVSYAVEPCSGHYFRVLYGEPSAPFDLTIKYPEGNHSCVPGLLEFTEKENGFIIDHYRSKTPNIPAFSVAPYQRFSKNKDGLGIEFYIYSGVSLDEDLFNSLFNIVQLFYEYFGNNGTNTYKFATVGEYDSTMGGAENKGNAIYFDTRFLNEPIMAGICAHEIFHNWNLFYVYFSGDLFEWFAEGGANFITAWAMEKIADVNVGALARRFFINSYINSEGFNTEKSLRNVDKIGGKKENLTLIYYYGALVWEQLRQKIGDNAFFTGLGRFFRDYGYKNVTYKELFSCLEKETTVNIKEYLEPWINQVPKINISITSVDVIETRDNYVTKIVIQIESGMDLELMTEVAYQTSVEGELFIKPVTFTKKGLQTIVFESTLKPVSVQIDPFYRVPRVNLKNCTWISNGK